MLESYLTKDETAKDFMANRYNSKNLFFFLNYLILILNHDNNLLLVFLIQEWIYSIKVGTKHIHFF